jgi:hypothetical protein
MASGSYAPIEEFLAFIERAKGLLPECEPVAPLEAFRSFLEASIPIILGRVRSSLPILTRRIRLLKRWLVPHDLLRIAGFSYAEDPYTELIAWALHPETHSESAIHRQKAWLRRAPFFSRLAFEEPAIPKTQYWTDAGIPDLILEYPDSIIVLEAKTGSEEHPTPKGDLQTIAYPKALARSSPPGNSKAIFTVFLTPDRREAANPEAFNTSFVDFCVSLAEEFEKFRLPDDVRWPFAMLLTHFLTCAIAPGVDISQFLKFASDRNLPESDEAFLITNFNEIIDVINVLAPEAA